MKVGEYSALDFDVVAEIWVEVWKLLSQGTVEKKAAGEEVTIPDFVGVEWVMCALVGFVKYLSCLLFVIY